MILSGLRSCVALALTTFALAATSQTLRVGIIGTDSSHAVAFTQLLNNTATKDHVSGAIVVAAYRGGNPHIALSHDRIDAISTQLREKWSIPFVSSIAQLCPSVDALLLLSVDPEMRLAEFQHALACRKPIFVDKPFAPSLRIAAKMNQLALQSGVPWFTASSLRFMVSKQPAGLLGAEIAGPGELGIGYQLDLAWYGIHSIEALYGLMGPGVQTVQRTHTEQSDLLTLTWSDGRIGTVRLIRPDFPFRAQLFYKEDTQQLSLAADYSPLVQQIVHFFQSKQAPVSSEEVLEIFAVMEAAQRSMQKHGAPQSIQAIPRRRITP